MDISVRLKKVLDLCSPALLAAVLCQFSMQAGASQESGFEATDWQFDERPRWQVPALYSIRVMGMGLAGLVSLDLHDQDPAVENFLDAMRSPRPRPDDDGPMFNYVLHPLWGSETYLRARDADYSMSGSFAFSMGASVVWEYFIESWTEHPSSQDLVYTTGLGWMLGEARYRLLQNADDRYAPLVDPLYTALKHVNMSLHLNEEGSPTPVFNVGWDI